MDATTATCLCDAQLHSKLGIDKAYTNMRQLNLLSFFLNNYLESSADISQSTKIVCEEYAFQNVFCDFLTFNSASTCIELKMD